MPRHHDASPPAEDQHSGLRWETLLRNTALVAVLLIFVWVVFNVRLPSLPELHADIAAWGWAAWLVFLGIYALVALTPIPVTVMALAGGVLFGVLEGTVLSVIGALIGCWGGYWIARGLGKQAVAKLLGSHYRTAEQHLQHAGFQAVVMLRLLPGFPYWPVNYGSGAFGVSQREYLAASVLSVIPGQVSLVAVGSFLANPNVYNGVIVGICWAVVLVMTLWSYRRWKRVKERNRLDATP